MTFHEFSLSVCLKGQSVEVAALGLPLAQNGLVSLLLLLNTLGVLELCQLCGALLVHLLLNDSALFAVSLVNLFKNVGLMILLHNSISLLSFFSLSLHAGDFIINDLLFIVKFPFVFISHDLSGADSHCTILVDLFHKVDSSHVLLSPLVFL
jgi:hypothetical protein